MVDRSLRATCRIAKWEEQPYAELDRGPNLIRASVTKAYEGDIAGTGAVEYLMMHRADGSATDVGLERVRGEVEGRTRSTSPCGHAR